MGTFFCARFIWCTCVCSISIPTRNALHTTPAIDESAEKKSDYKEHADNCSLWRKESLLLQPRMDGRTTREGQADRCSEQRQNKKRILNPCYNGKTFAQISVYSIQGPYYSVHKDQIIPACNELSLLTRSVSCVEDFTITKVYCVCAKGQERRVKGPSQQRTQYTQYKINPYFGNH